jgi:hypothetical protein
VDRFRQRLEYGTGLVVQEIQAIPLNSPSRHARVIRDAPTPNFNRLDISCNTDLAKEASSSSRVRKAAFTRSCSARFPGCLLQVTFVKLTS